MELSYPQKSNGMYILRRTHMDDIAREFLREYSPSSLERPAVVDVDLLAEECLFLDVSHKPLTRDESILGMTVFEDVSGVPCFDEHFLPTEIDLPAGSVVIHSWLLSHNNWFRRRFTLAHEISHWILHRSYHSPGKQKYHFRAGPDSLITPPYIACRATVIDGEKFEFVTDYDWEEWQANSLAAAILMPLDMFSEEAKFALRKAGLSILDEKSARERYNIIRELSDKFEVSKKAVEIRLDQAGLIHNGSINSRIRS